MQNKDGLFGVSIFVGDDIDSIDNFRAPACPRVGDFISLAKSKGYKPYRVYRVEWVIRDCEVDYVAVNVLPEKRD